MADSFAEPSDLEARWRPLTDSEQGVVEALMIDASTMIRERWSDVDARIESGALMEDSLIRIVCGMVKRALINSDQAGVESGSVTTGPFTDARKYTNPNGNLYLSADDIRLLDGYGTPRAKVGWLV